MRVEEGLFRMVYVSRNAIPAASQEAEIARILEVSRRNNQAAGITGALLYSADSFAQALEGPEAAMEALYARLSRDPRHAEVLVISAGPVAARQFSQWSMAFAGRHDGLSFAALQGGLDPSAALLAGAAGDPG
ncbi:BLUF domain-containing protein [Paracraurococcus ruber]|nr:BLUF domain-containing protein [Paracraurococcus ruber]